VITPKVTYSCETWILKETILTNYWYLKEKSEGKYLAQIMKMVYGK
jgi:hypothetical protein